MILCFTGDGKGKTTAAIGIAVRARGHGKSVSFFKFMKGIESGEDGVLRNIGVDVHLLGSKSFVDFKNPSTKDIERAKKGLEFASSSDSEILILDEVLTAVHFSLLERREVEDFARPFAKNVERHLILTGRGLWDSMREEADLVSEIRNVKHYFDEAFFALEGLDM